MALLQWDNGGNLYNQVFQDCYFSKEDGLKESRYVFLEGNNLPEAWQGKEQFCIGECGFGTGLNLLALWELLSTCKNRPQRLIYYTFDGYPLLLEELKKAHSFWQELKQYAQKLHQFYPPNPKEGLYEFDFSSLHVKLIIGMAPDAICQFDSKIDAWFLDGFAPSKNPQMWSSRVFEAIAKCSKKGTTFATFTAATKVRRGLEKVGFSVQKRKGFGKKREMAYGTFE